MGVLSTIEDGLKKIVESPFQVFGGLDPIELSIGLKKKMEQHKKEVFDKSYVPHVFYITVDEVNSNKIAPFIDEFSRIIIREIKQWAQEMGYEIAGTPTLAFMTGNMAGKIFDVRVAYQKKDSDPLAGEGKDQADEEHAMTIAASKKGEAVLLAELINNTSAERMAINKREVIIGRDGGCDLSIMDATVSHRHAHLKYAYGKWVIKDLGSRNGTRVNHQRIETAALYDGDKVQVGSVKLVFSVPPSQREKEPDLVPPNEGKEAEAASPHADWENVSDQVSCPEPSPTYVTAGNKEQDLPPVEDLPGNGIPAGLFPDRDEDIRIKIGKDAQGDVFWMPESAVPEKLDNGHLFIVGSSGSGKTQLLKEILSQMHDQNMHVLIFDFNDDYIDPAFIHATGARIFDVMEGIGINPLELSKDPTNGTFITPKIRIFEIASIFRDIFRLGEQQHRILKKAIADLYAAAGLTADPATWGKASPEFHRIPEFVQKRATSNLPVDALLNRIDPLFDMEIFRRGASHSFHEMLHQVSVLRLCHLPGIELKLAVSRFILDKLYNMMIALGHSSRIRAFAVIDEAHKLVNSPSLSSLVRESRKFGLGLILASQSPADFHQSVLANVGTKIILKLPYARDAKTIVEQLGVDKLKQAKLLQSIQNLSPFHGFIKNVHHHPYREIQLEAFYKRLHF